MLSNQRTFLQFLKSRIKRLFPAFLFVLLVSTIIAYFLMGYTSLEEYSKTAIFSLLNIVNFYYAFEDQYWANASQYKPLLHYWSLSVEWQFYIFTPVLLKLLNDKNWKYIILSLILISFLFTEYSIINSKELDFFSPHNRYWEYLAGVFVAYFHKTNKYIIQNKLFQTIGLIGIIMSFLLIKETNHLSLYTLLPILSTMIILFYIKERTIINNLLNLKPLRFIGEISYPIYLWHFPVIVFYRYYTQDVIPVYTMIALLILSIFLGYLTNKYIEKGSWSLYKIDIKKFTFLALSTAILIFSMNIFYMKDYLSSFIINNYKTIDNHSDNLDIVIMGDSFMDDTFDSFQLNNKTKNLNLYRIYFQEECYKGIYKPLEHQVLLKRYPWFKNTCETSEQWFQKFKGFIETKKPDTLIITQLWNTQSLEVIKGFPLYLNKVSPRTKLYLINRPFFTKNVPDLLKSHGNNGFSKKLFAFRRDVDFTNYLKRYAKGKYKIIDFAENTCDDIKKTCQYLDENGNLLYRDDAHWTNKGKEFFSQRIIKIIEEN